ncbi:MAG: glycerol-3-phosphate dehydrogenase [Baekduia sp.]|nr:glycerol-3-phosphate dehydrogenase [Baekduia sp.]
MSAEPEVTIVGGGVVGLACALAFARRGAAVTLLEAQDGLALAASGTNSGILHTGFDSKPGELETELILRAALLRPPVLAALGVPFARVGALLTPHGEADRAVIAGLAANTAANGVEVHVRDGDGALEVPGEGITDPVAFAGALAAAAVRHGAAIRTGVRVGEPVAGDMVVNAAGLGAGRVARLYGDASFDVFPRKGEFFVFDVAPPEQILLPVPTARTKGVLVFGTLDGRTIAGPTAVDLDEEDWSVRPEARDEILAKAAAMHPPLAGAEPAFAYAGLRPAGRDGANYVVRRSDADPRLIHAAAIRSTGLTASLAIAERVVALAGLGDRPEDELRPGGDPAAGSASPWWRRSAEHRAALAGERA